MMTAVIFIRMRMMVFIMRKILIIRVWMPSWERLFLVKVMLMMCC